MIHDDDGSTDLILLGWGGVGRGGKPIVVGGGEGKWLKRWSPVLVVWRTTLRNGICPLYTRL